jgi:hypothetical protein
VIGTSEKIVKNGMLELWNVERKDDCRWKLKVKNEKG